MSHSEREQAGTNKRLWCDHWCTAAIHVCPSNTMGEYAWEVVCSMAWLNNGLENIYNNMLWQMDKYPVSPPLNAGTLFSSNASLNSGVNEFNVYDMFIASKWHLIWPVSRECTPQEPGRIEYYISYSVYVVILVVCLRFKPHWMFQIYKYGIKVHEELTSYSSAMHSYLFPLLDVLYRQVGNLSFWTMRCTEFRHGGQ